MYGFSRDQMIASYGSRCDALRQRLENGWNYCERRPDDRNAESLFLDLLRQYEQSYRDYVSHGGRMA